MKRGALSEDQGARPRGQCVRTGDDTSGRDWSRTKKMGINTLAFRSPQQGNFFDMDADCVGLTNAIPWSLNRQWLDLLARSGTPLFVSAAPDAVKQEQRNDCVKPSRTPLFGSPFVSRSTGLRPINQRIGDLVERCHVSTGTPKTAPCRFDQPAARRLRSFAIFAIS